MYQSTISTPQNGAAEKNDKEAAIPISSTRRGKEAGSSQALFVEVWVQSLSQDGEGDTVMTHYEASISPFLRCCLTWQPPKEQYYEQVQAPGSCLSGGIPFAF